jgi:putative flippase GtrA
MTQMSRFFFVGGLATLVDYVIFSIAVFLHVHYSLAITLGYLVGFIVHFTMSKKHVFLSGSKINHPLAELFSVFLIALSGLLLNIIIVWIFHNFFNLLDIFSSRLLAIILVFFWSYFARKLFVYH